MSAAREGSLSDPVEVRYSLTPIRVNLSNETTGRTRNTANLRNADGRAGDSKESQRAGDQRDDQEPDSVIKHRFSLPRRYRAPSVVLDDLVFQHAKVVISAFVAGFIFSRILLR